MTADKLKETAQDFEKFVEQVRTSLADGTFLGLVTALSYQSSLTTAHNFTNLDGNTRKVAELLDKLNKQFGEALVEPEQGEE